MQYITILKKQEVKIMANNNNNHKVVPQAANALDKMKYEIASQVGVNLKNGYNGDITSRDAGKVGGNITKKLIEMAEKQLSNQK